MPNSPSLQQQVDDLRGQVEALDQELDGLRTQVKHAFELIAEIYNGGCCPRGPGMRMPPDMENWDETHYMLASMCFDLLRRGQWVYRVASGFPNLNVKQLLKDIRAEEKELSSSRNWRDDAVKVGAKLKKVKL